MGNSVKVAYVNLVSSSFWRYNRSTDKDQLGNGAGLLLAVS